MSSTQASIVVLDRDGVINYDSDAYVKSVDEWQAIPGSLEAIAKLNRLGYQIYVVTNQSGVARGMFDEQTLAAMHDKMVSELSVHGGSLAGIYYCPHGPDDACECRKPKDGMLRAIEVDIDQSLTGAYMVGDSIRDLAAGLPCGCLPVLVRTGKGARSEAKLDQIDATVEVYDSLASFVDQIAERTA